MNLEVCPVGTRELLVRLGYGIRGGCWVPMLSEIRGGGRLGAVLEWSLADPDYVGDAEPMAIEDRVRRCEEAVRMRG